MALGRFFTLPQQTPFQTGASLPGAKLYFYQTGTTTDQTVYTTAALSTGHSQPVVADSDGFFAAIYLDPDSTVDYTIVLKDSADVTIYTENAVPRYNENFETGSFVGTWVGFSSDPSNDTVTWFRQGNIMNVILPVGDGTSNATSFGIGDMPAAVRPTTAQYGHLPFANDNGAHLAGGVGWQIATDGAFTFAPADATYDTTGWTASGQKGLQTIGNLFYRLRDD